MHKSVMTFLKANIHPREIFGKRVLEVGSCDVNGSPRTVLVPMKPLEYIGVDQGPGPGVDLVCGADHLSSRFGRDSFDVVLSTEMLEHAEDWKPTIREMKAVLQPEGLLVVTTRGPGFPYHGFPHDHWRFTPALFKEIFSDMAQEILIPDPEFPGILLKAWKPLPFVERDLSGISPLPAPPRP